MKSIKTETTEIVMLDDSPYSDYKKGDIGTVDGYVRGGTGPCAVVILDKNDAFVLAPINSLVKRTYPTKKP